MVIKAEAYLDSGAFIAFCDQSDTWHPLFSGLFARAKSLVTTPLVITETHGWFLRRFDSYRALKFLALVQELTILQMIPVSSIELAEGAKILRKFSDQKLTLTDAVGLHILKSQSKLANWSTDRHMTLTGRRLVIDEH